MYAEADAATVNTGTNFVVFSQLVKASANLSIPNSQKGKTLKMSFMPTA